MSSVTVGAKSIAKQSPIEREYLDIKLQIDFIDIIPNSNQYGNTSDTSFSDGSNQIDRTPISVLNYGQVFKTANDYIERFSINPNISSVNVEITAPSIEPSETLKLLETGFTECPNSILVNGNNIPIDNSALKDPKVRTQFKTNDGESSSAKSADTPTEVSPSQTKAKQENLSKINPTLSQDDINFIEENSTPLENYFIKFGSSVSKTGTITKIVSETTEQFAPYFKYAGNITSIGDLMNKAGNIGLVASIGYKMPAIKRAVDNADNAKEKMQIVGEESGEIIGGVAGGRAGMALGTWAGGAIIAGITVAGISVTAPVAIVIVGGAAIIGLISGDEIGKFSGKRIGGYLGSMTGEFIDNNFSDK